MLERNTYMRSAAQNVAQKSMGNLRAPRGWLLKIPIISRSILRKIYLAIPHKIATNLQQVQYI